jgi:CBS domain containing-hemolysin-like protein
MTTLQLLVSAALVAANGFFVVAEFSLTRVRPTQVAEWERKGAPGAASVRHAIEHLDAYLSACQLGITMASLGLGAIGETAFHDLLEPVLGSAARVGSIGLASALAFGIITLVHVVAGELAPKSVAIARTEQAARLVAPPMRLFYTVTRPLVDLFNELGNLLLRPFGIPPAREVGHAPPTEDELHELLREAARHGLIDRDEQLLSQNALTFDDLRVRQIMVPRRKLHYVTTDEDLAAVVDRIRQTGLLRLPLCEPEGGLDSPVGLLHARELIIALADRAQVPSLASLARPLDRVPETLVVDELLRRMRGSGQEFVLVVDEHGTTVGGVGFENIVEVIIGELEDEFDPTVLPEMRREDGALVVSGSAFIYAVGRVLGVKLPEVHQATIGGVVIERLGRLPEPGDVVVLDGLQVEVTDVQDGHVNEVRIVQASSASAPSSD